MKDRLRNELGSLNGWPVPDPFQLVEVRLRAPGLTITGTAQRPSIPPRNIITTKFFFLDDEANAGRLNPAKNKVVAVPFKKSLLVIFMLLIPQVD